MALWQDLRFAIRTLAKTPGFTAVALVTLALGIGANSAIYSVVNAVLLKGLPYPNAGRLVFLNESLPKAPFLNVAWPDFLDWRAQNQVFSEMAAFQPNSINFSGGEEPKPVKVGWVSSSFFSLLGAKPAMGRTFGEADDRPGAAPVVVVSYTFWRNELKGDPQVVGRDVAFENGAFSVAGVLGPEFQFQPWEFDIYFPVGLRALNPNFTNRANHPGLVVIAAIRAGLSLDRARADLKTIMGRLALAFPESNRNETAALVPIAERLVGSVRTDLLMLLGAVAFVLLIACANVAHLALARAASRQREFAIRAAIGASRWRLIRQLLAESTLLSLAGGAAGLLLAHWSLPPLLSMYPNNVPGLKEARLDWDVALFTLGVCLLSGALFGLAPMLQAARAGLDSSIKAGIGGNAGRPGQRIRSAVFVAEIAIAIVLTVSAGLLLRSLAAVLDVDPGFRADHLLALDVVHSGGGQPSRNFKFFEDAIDRIAHEPGVESASAVMCPPLAGTLWTSPYVPAGETAPAAMQQPWTALNMVMPGYFQTMRMRLLEGRLFARGDDSRSTNVAIVNQRLARLVWPDGGAVGKRLHVKYAAGELLEVVGVIADVKQFGLDAPGGPEVYVPAAQMPVNFMTIVARTSLDPAALVRPTVAAIKAVEKGQPVARVTPMTELIAASVARRKFAAFLLGLFSALALVLAVVGVAGVMAYTVAQRTREFGIRMAMGAQPGQVSRLVLRHGLRLTGLGVAIGAGAAWGLTRLLASMLFHVKSHDPLTFALVAGLLTAFALAACLLPARRAARVDPMTALRYD
jgi:putative ABC transport system permease protein